MTQEYTPTTEKVKQAYSGLHEKNYYDFTVMQREENFDRWYDAHDAQIRAEAWEDGRIAEHDEAYGWGDAINPYKEQKQ